MAVRGNATYNAWGQLNEQVRALKEEHTELLATLVFVRFAARQQVATHDEALALMQQIRDEASRVIVKYLGETHGDPEPAEEPR